MSTPPAAVASQPQDKISTVSSGTFRSVPGERAAGSVNIIKVDNRNYVRFDVDTDIGASLDPIITFGNDNRADLSINLGSLKGTKGSRNYEIPDSVHPNKYLQVLIHCRAFDVPIGYADLR